MTECSKIAAFTTKQKKIYHLRPCSTKRSLCMDYRVGLWQSKTLEAARTEERVYLKQQFRLFAIPSKEENTLLLLTKTLHGQICFTLMFPQI